MGAREWIAIINAHILWKQRLLDYIEGSNEKFDAKAIASGSECMLSNWLENNKKQFSNTEFFETASLRHANFHHTAGKVIQLVDERRPQEASSLLRGDYAEISEQLKRDIVKLSLHMN